MSVEMCLQEGNTMARSEQDNRADGLDSYLTAAGETAAYRMNVDGKDAGGAKLVMDRRPDLAGSHYARLD